MNAHFQYQQMQALVGIVKGSPKKNALCKATQAKLIQTVQPKGKIRSVAMCKDHSSIVTASKEGLIQWWNPLEGNEERHRRIHGMRTFFPSRGQEFIMIESLNKSFGLLDSRELQIYDLGSKQVIHSISASNKISRAKLSNTGRFICESNNGIFARDIRETAQGKLNMRYDPGTISQLSLSSDGNFLAMTLLDPCKTKVWNLSTGEKVTEIDGETTHIALSDNGSSIVIVSLDQKMKLIDVCTGEVINQMNLSPKFNGIPKSWQKPLVKALYTPEEQTSISISSDCCFLAAGFENGGVVVWETRTGKITNCFDASRGHHQNKLSCISFSADSSHIVSGCEDSEGSYVQIWDICRWKTRRNLLLMRELLTTERASPKEDKSDSELLEFVLSDMPGDLFREVMSFL